MGRTERLFRLANLLRDRKRLRFDEMLERLDVSPATLKRDLKYLREQLGTPVEYDAFERSYQVADSTQRPRYEMPGVWFSESDLNSLLLAQSLLADIDPSGGLAPRLESVVRRAESLITQGDAGRELASRIRVATPGRRDVEPAVFDAMTAALMRRRRLRLEYLSRSRQAKTHREVSPQRLVHYRTWYLDGWCHDAKGLRRFALEAVGDIALMNEAAVEISLSEVERLMDGGYGAFAGEPKHWAVLVFSPQVSQWAGREQWHPMQRMRHLEDGRLELMVPYDKPSELVMDILRYGPEVEVVGNPSLRSMVAAAAHAVSAMYASGSGAGD
jgi:predicted DNA-binding transcriptional regulator YafY